MYIHLRSLWIVFAIFCLIATPFAAFAQVERPAGQQDIQPPLDVEATMNQVISLLQRNQWKEASELLERVIKAEPKNTMAMLMAAQVYMQMGVEMAENDRQAAHKPLRRSAEIMRSFREIKKNLSRDEKQLYAVAIYNEACCAAVEQDKDTTIKLLNEAIEAGFIDLETLQDDSDFDAVKDDPRFVELVDRLKKKLDTDLDDELLDASEI